MIIRAFVEEDAERLAQLYLESRLEGFTWVDAAEMSLADFTRNTRGEEVLVGVENNKVVGFVSFRHATNFIHNLYVHHKSMQKGYGSQLLDAATQRLDNPITLRCQKKNRRAVKFYKSKGWQCIDEGASWVGEYFVMRYDGLPSSNNQMDRE